MDQLINCPICGGDRLEPFISVKDFSISGETFNLAQCIGCGFVFTNPRPDVGILSNYYDSPDYISHSNSRAGLLNKVYQFIRTISIKKKLSLISAFAGSDKTILDIGCGTGEFLNYCKKNKWKTAGVEPNEKARNFALNQYQLNVIGEESIHKIPSKSFNTITLWHVLEHVFDLKNRVIDLSRLIKDNGTIIVAVPNYKSHDAKFYREYWAAYDVPRHLYHFSEKTIKKLFNENGFDWVNSFPMKFDSYYVSILSQKYKKSNMSILKALYQGLKSNLAARGKPENYSSVIYVFKKR